MTASLRVVVLGASGGCGRELVRQARARGHHVIAVARPSADVEALEGVSVQRGDLTSADFLAGCFDGADAVLSALGLRLPGLAPWAKPEVPEFLDRSTPAVIEAMKRAGVRRILAVSAGGVGEGRAQVPAFFRAFIASTSLRTAYAALDRMERAYLASGLDVCLPRPTGLTNGPATGKAVVVERLAGQAQIPRADVASFMLDQLAAPAFAHRTPMITVTGAA